MPRRTIPGIGTVDLPEEVDMAARNILANPGLEPDAAAREAWVLCAVAGFFDATPAVDEYGRDGWAECREQVRVEREGVQQEMVA